MPSLFREELDILKILSMEGVDSTLSCKTDRQMFLPLWILYHLWYETCKSEV